MHKRIFQVLPLLIGSKSLSGTSGITNAVSGSILSHAFSSKAKMKLALCQIKVGSDKEENLRTAEKSIRNACSENPNMVVLPEVWNSPYSTASFPKYAEFVPSIGHLPDAKISPSTALLCDLAKSNQIWLVGGSIPEVSIDSTGTKKLYNTCVIFNPDGQIVGKHRKVHLFDIDVPGRITFKESDSLTAGDSITIIDTPWGKVGIGICYDIRFPELAMLYRKKGCQMLIYPGAFNMVTGPAHWELLQRARAVDNQLYVAACSPARDEKGSYIAWGHSTVVSPWGEIVATCEEGENIVHAELDFANVDTMRQNIPCWSQKREDIYFFSEKS